MVYRKKIRANSYALLGFTLAEVLIVLLVIGVVAALTIPMLMKNYQKTQYVSAFNKTYSVLNDVYNMVTVENGSMANALSTTSTLDDIANVFIAKMKIAKNCGTGSAAKADAGCFPNKTYKMLNSTSTLSTNFATDSDYSTFMTSDGISFAIRASGTDKTCNTSKTNSVDPTSHLLNVCSTIYVDVNGPNQGPTEVGRDLFLFWYTKTQIFPVGGETDMWNNNCSNGNGLGCAGKVLLERAMNY